METKRVIESLTNQGLGERKSIDEEECKVKFNSVDKPILKGQLKK